MFMVVLYLQEENASISTSTLGTSNDEQTKDTLDGDVKEKFMAYNFPPFSVNEVGRIGARREMSMKIS